MITLNKNNTLAGFYCILIRKSQYSSGKMRLEEEDEGKEERRCDEFFCTPRACTSLSLHVARWKLLLLPGTSSEWPVCLFCMSLLKLFISASLLIGC
jgi:hypothetical protein